MAVVYCKNCGESKSLEPKAAPRAATEDAAPKPHRRKRESAPAEPTLPFGMPVAIGEGGRSMFEPEGPPSAADLAQLERDFFGAGTSPARQAEIIAEMAARTKMGGRPVHEGDPPGTYRPGTGETLGRSAGVGE
jgi:hypothetical protein